MTTVSSPRSPLRADVEIEVYFRLREFLVGFYAKHNPDMSRCVDKVAEQWAGSESQLFHKMLSRYPSQQAEYEWMLQPQHKCRHC
ncbi:hypothetical protein DIPPA_17417 [Diplonema papillatum]|nr:hypothetical protein DIPPA_17417 [Diplonema papillatum]